WRCRKPQGGRRPECAMECAIGLVTRGHNLARPGTTAVPPSRHKLRHVAHLGTTWHDVAQPGTTPRRVFESCRAYHFFRRIRGRNGGLERWGLGVCNPVCNGPGHNLARPGTTWHDLAQVAGGRCRRTCGAYFAAPGARASGPGAPVVAD